MEQNWKPSRHLDDLFSQEMATHIATALEKRITEEEARRMEGIHVVNRIGERQSKAFAQKLGEEELKRLRAESSSDVLEFLQGRQLQPPRQAPSDLVDVHFPLLPVPQSCRSSFGPYNRWGGLGTGGLVGETLDIRTGSDRNFGGGAYFTAAGFGSVWGGSGCWFTVGTTGQAQLKATFITNGHAVLISPGGVSETHIRFFASVWGASENTWVDRGGFGTALVDRYMWAFDDFQMRFTDVNVLFDTHAGGSYYCAGGFNIWTTVAGFAFGGASIANLMNPLTVCAPFP